MGWQLRAGIATKVAYHHHHYRAATTTITSNNSSNTTNTVLKQFYSASSTSKMPKAPKKKSNNSHNISPLDASSPAPATSEAKPGAVKKAPRSKDKGDPKASHLYTDDNPATTIHGTGFKDRAAADRTLELISRRSLTYQFQTVNTMFHRAKGHKHKGAGMEQAMAVFREWLDVTYPRAKESMRAGGFKPLLSKECVGKYLERIREEAEAAASDATGAPGGGGAGGGGAGGGGEGAGGDGDEESALALGLRFAERYVGMEKGKRLGNTLMDDGKPEEADWERKRYDVLCALVPEGKEKRVQWDDKQLWDQKGKVKPEHIKLIAWAWSPVGEKRL